MQSIYVGAYTRANAIPGTECSEGARILLHRVEDDFFILGDDLGGECMPDRPIPAEVGHRVMSGDFGALADAGDDVAAFVQRPNFKFAERCARADTDEPPLS